MIKVTDKQLDLMRHTLGYNYEPRKVRNWIGVDVGSQDHVTALELVAARMMVERGDVDFSPSRSYVVTEDGHALVRSRQPKQTRPQRRYDRYLDIREVCPDLKFIDYCKNEKDYQ